MDLHRCSSLLLCALLASLLVGSCVHDRASLVTGDCADGSTLCGELCVDTQLDPGHCGACDAACAAGELCSLGMCGLECVGGTTQCADRCVDTMVDPEHCGACDTPCSDDSTCAAGSCTLLCGTSPCQPGDHLWSRRLGGALNDVVHDIEQDAAGNIYAVGYFQGVIDVGGGPLGNVVEPAYTILLAKFGPTGQHIWSRAFGDTDGRGYDIAIDGNGDLVVTGIFRGAIDFGVGPMSATGIWDGFVAKLDADGIAKWSKRYGDTTDTRVHFVDTDAANNIVITGIFQGTIDFGNGPRTGAGSWDGFVVKLDSSGTALWDRVFGDLDDQRARAVAVGPGGDIYFGSRFKGSVDFGGGPLTSAGEWDGYLAKLDSDGNHEWSKAFGDAGTEQDVFEVAVDADDNVFIAGFFMDSWNLGGGTMTSAGGKDAFVAKYDAAGSPQWSKQFGDDMDQQLWGVASDGMGGAVVSGYFQGTVDLGMGAMASVGDWDFVLAHYAADGSLAWVRTFGDAAAQVGYDVSVGPNGRIISTGGFAGAVDFGGGPLASAGVDDAWLAAFAP